VIAGLSRPRIRIILSGHARQRAMERDISEEMIESVINNPIETVFDDERQNFKSYALVRHPSTNNEAFLMVIHSSINTEVTIISTMWQTTGGLRRNGLDRIR